MRSFAAIALALAAASQAKKIMMFDATDASNVSTSDCAAPGSVHIIVARASLEAPGYGITAVIKDNVMEQFPGSTAEAVEYPATLNDYINSETTGAIAARKLITSYAAKCPCGPIALMGYSQGAQVIGDAAVGQDDNGFPDNSTIDTPLPTSILSRIAAITIFGDPSLLVNQSFHVGNSTKNSVFPRHNSANFDMTNLASRTQSYCDDGDPYCAAGGNLVVHLSYIGEYGSNATDFAVKQIQAYNAKPAGTCNSTGVAPSGTGTAPSTGKPTASGTAPVSRGPSVTGTAGGMPKPTGTGYASPSGTGSGAMPSSSYPVGASPNAASVAGVSSVMSVLALAALAWML